jgi:hypothetical protein
MLIDCDQCEMRDVACADCVVTALLGSPERRCDLDEAERRALRVLADARLVSPLRLRTRPQLRAVPPGRGTGAATALRRAS